MDAIPRTADDASRSSKRPVKRAPLVYGKRSSLRQISPFMVPPADGHEEFFKHDHARAAPLPRSLLSPSPSNHADESELSLNPDAADPFQFGFRQRLKELDEQFDNHDAPSSKPSSSPSTVPAGLSHVKDFENVSMGTAILSPQARCSSGDPRCGSLSQSPTLLHATSAHGHPPNSPPVRRRTRRAPNPVLSDSEAEELSGSSSASPVQHAITTPHTRSSPTPPTSGEIPMVSSKAKGKAPARDVLPLVFDGEQPSVTELPIKSKKVRRSGSLARPKIKEPTKKERREAGFESSRIVADRPVEVIRTQKQKHSLSAFFTSLRRDNVVTPASGTELPSDPIERFSSPTDKSVPAPVSNSMFGAPTGLLRMSAHVGTSNQLSPYEKTKALPPLAVGSDDEVPPITAIIQRASGKQKKLQAIKQVALQHAGISNFRDDDSEEDDLLVVKDDMHAVAREEAAQRKLDKAHGSPVKDMTLLRRIKHPSVRPVVISPRKLSKQELQELAKPSFARMGKETKGHLSKKELDQLMITQHTEEQLKSIRRHEEEWVKRGGRLSWGSGGEGAQTSLLQKLEVYAEQGLKAVETGSAACVDESDDDDYSPDLRDSASPEPMEEDEDGGKAGEKMEVSRYSQPSVNDDDDEVPGPSRRNGSGRRRPRLVVGSDDEKEPSVHHDSPCVQRDSTSSMESQTEDENDKENSAKLMYDRSEDKENKAVVRHELSSSESAFSARLGCLPGTENIVRGGSSLASVTDLSGTASPKGDVRSPLKDISKDEDDLFLSPSSKTPFTEQLLRSTTTSPPRASTPTVNLGSPPALRSERISRINRLSLDLQNDENDPSGLKPLQPSFLERLHSQVSLEPSLAPLNPLENGGFSQLFSAEDRSLKKSIDGAENNGLSLTLDVGLKPALEVSGTLIQKAESIFEKEQEYVIAAAVQQNDKPKELLYVNDHGFLTQSRPEGSSPQMYRMTPSQASKFIGTQVHLTQTQSLSARPPLRTLSFTTSRELSPELRSLRRLRKRSPSPLDQRTLGRNSDQGAKLNAFEILGKVLKPLSERHKEKHEKSEFVAVEAEESDEDDMFGFGEPRKEDEEEDDNEQDKIVEGLLDDTAMDAETEAADLVQERYRGHGEEDDQKLQKLHQDAIEGKFRMKRRDRGVGFEDESDEDEDEDARRIRQRMYKKRKIEGDSLEALGQNEETRAFYNTYHQDLIDEDDEFGHLRHDVAVPADNDDGQDENPEERETIAVDEIRQRVREIAQNNAEMEVLDPEDTSWIDQSMTTEVDDAVRVKVVEHRRSISAARRPNTGQIDFDVERSDRYAESEHERKQLKTWAKNHSRQPQGTGRSGNGTAVTGHPKAKTGGGSLRPTQPSNPSSVSEASKTKTSRLLSKVSSRSDRFA